MSSAGNHKRPFEGNFESLEDRRVFTANPLAAAAGALVETAIAVSPQDAGNGQAPGDSASDYARDRYGLDGFGQTVVIIDSGIAYDHYALGGGLGSGHRVVGGWDFAEDDADPYDDGAAGFHGTHVAGIVGSSDSQYTGLAPGVDLVGLRVFDDQGNGNFDWIESALDWVHHNLDSFEHPITTVNMSIGADWNADNIPDWATLEDELQLLENQGIFVSVSAGNDFANHQAVGVNYPAASPFVVPVASIDGDGDLSSFSQRNDRVLAAPGENITSTAPDYLYGFDGVTDDFVSASGTSMSAPYVAGASVLLRQALEAMGQSQIDQNDLLSVLRSTADQIYDSVTDAHYDRINLERALDTIVGADEYGSTHQSAEQITPSEDYYSITGAINSTSDQDHFSYTAQESGELTIDMLWYSGGENSSNLLVNGQATDSQHSLQVTAGESYSFAVTAGSSIGRYSVSLNFASESVNIPYSAAAPDAATASRTMWTAASSGTYEITLDFGQVGTESSVEVRNESGQVVASATNPAATETFTIAAAAGESFQIDLVGHRGSAVTVTAEFSGAGMSSGPGGNSNIIAFGSSFRDDTESSAPIDEVLVEFGPLDEASTSEVDAALLGWKRFSDWMETVARDNSLAAASDSDQDEASDLETGSLEIYSLSLDEALCDDGCWRR